MSATTHTSHVQTTAQNPIRVTQTRVIRSEYKKLSSLRSTRWCLLLAVVIMLGAPIIYSLVEMSQWSTLSHHDRVTFDSIDAAAAGHYLAQLAIGFLGVMTITGEYATGMIRSSFMAVPRRLPLLWAKLIVFAGVVFTLMLISSVIAFFATQAIVTVHHVNVSIAAPHALRVVIMTPVIITIVGMLSIALGAVTRSTAGGAAILVFLMFVLSGVAALLPASISNDVDPYLPINAAYTAATSTFDPGPHLSTWGGFGIFCALVTIIIGLGAARLTHGDA
jgi:ABC-2 type transport system permease protein